VVDILLVLIELFLPTVQHSRLRRYERILVKILVIKSGVGHVERKFQAGKGVVHQRLLASEN